MDVLNKPVEMIAVCSPEGELMPARFRLEDEVGERVTVRIRQVRRREVIPYLGVESLRYECIALLGGQLRRFELRYAVRAHRWLLWQFLDRDVNGKPLTEDRFGKTFES